MKIKLAILGLAISAMGVFAADDRPNFIVFLTDDQTRNSIGVYGNEQVKTPNLDKLAQGGTVYRNNYATTSICMASRASIMTGMYEYKTGCNFDKGPLWRSKWEKSYPMLLREAGYYTGFAGKFGFGVKKDGAVDDKYNTYEALAVKDFDWFAGGPDQTSYATKQNKNIAKYAKQYPHSTRAYGAACSDFIRDAVKTGKPFCLSMSFKAPHVPNTPDPFFNDVYKDTVWETAENYGRENGKHISVQAKISSQYAMTWRDYNAKNFQKTQRLYHQLIHGVDYAVGMILETLKEVGADDNTIIIYTSDNGFCAGSHGFGHKALPYEEHSKTPLIILDPRAKKADTIWREPVTANIDLAPTILDYAGLSIPENMDGKSLRKLIQDPTEKHRDYINLIHARGTFPSIAFTVVSKDAKYIYYPYAEKIDPTEELYILKDDPIEMHNQIKNPEFQAILDEMKVYHNEALAKWKAENVKRASYDQLEIIFDQNVPWETKRNNIPSDFATNKVNYKKVLGIIGYTGDPTDYEAVLAQSDAFNKAAESGEAVQKANKKPKKKK